METRTIEANLTIIADSLVRIADQQSEMLEFAKARRAAAPVAAQPAPAPEPHQWTYETLKAELQRRGVEIAKGTKMTTLLKFWELHKNDITPAVADAPAALSDPAEETVTVEAAPTTEEPTVTVEEPATTEEPTVTVEAPVAEETTTIVEDEEPAPAPVAADPEVVEPVVTEEPAPAPVAEEAKTMSVEEARAAIMEIGYDGEPAQIEAMRIALQNAGVARFALLEDNQRAGFVADYKAELDRLNGGK